MNRTLKTMGLLCLVLLGLAGTAGAQTLIHSTDWTTGSYGSTTAGAAGTTTGAGDGWIDNAGGVATAGSAGKLTIAAGSIPWSTGAYVLRPASENVRDEQQSPTFLCPGQSGTAVGVVFRWQSGNTDYFANAYFGTGAGPNNGSLSVYTDTNGTNAQIGVSQAFTIPATGDLLTFTPSVSGANPSTLGVKLVDTTTGSTLVSPYSFTDSTGPQTAGQMGLTAYGTGYVLTDRTYNLAAPALTNLGVSSAYNHYSPGNWAGDTGRGGSVYRRTWNNGAYDDIYWTASASPTAALNITNQTSGSYISYFLNGVLTDNVAVPASGTISISGVVPSAANELTFYTRNSPQSARWNDANAYTYTGLSVDTASSAGTAPAWSGEWILKKGTSIDEGIQANDGADDFLADFNFQTMQAYRALGYDVCISACGYSGWLRPGDSGGDVPAFYPVSGGVYQGGGNWNQIDSTTSLLDSNGHISAYGQTGQEPSLIELDYGPNEAISSSSVSDTQASVTQVLPVLRTAAPNAITVVDVPFGMYAPSVYSAGTSYVNALKNGSAAYLAAHPADTKTSLLDLGPNVSNALASPLYGSNGQQVHWNRSGHSFAAPQALAPIIKKLNPPVTLGRGRRLN